MLKRFIPLLWLLLECSCSTLPDKPLMTPAEVWSHYVQQPANLSAVYSTRVKIWFRSIALILYVEQTEQALAIAALSPAGIKIFEARGGSNLVHKAVYIPQSRERLETFSAAAWKDLKFLREPPASTIPDGWISRRGRWSVEQELCGVRIRYEFDAFTGALLQKEFFENARRVSRIRFSDEATPIVIENFSSGYRLFLKPKLRRSRLQAD
ncbi:MAG TPA: hypothetical protein DCZ95_19980 [Verrucomicrobia bacterium]|nr:MAG: hypothetical protein A2X46_17885 [Lentisphaerae bacterium GWF2_57_35]HBA86365.1 hypothetical protein [Verrucomicrobiota bacterium]